MSKTGYSAVLSEVKQPDLVTERLLLRSFHLEDAVEVQALAENYNVSKTTLNIPYPYQPGMAEAWINTHQDGWKANSAVVYAITIQQTGQLAGQSAW
jgi:RimJ/RimL family protein N-acetyltransferase